ncbi:MAG: DUF4199 domain-containing protein [Prevotella sp.]|jgi:hypothetical protein|nr:DUF4199 domain-containing protein [Prevotella sp.]
MPNNIDINGRETSPLKYAMHYGLYLGIFWALKYLVYIAAMDVWVHFIYLYYLLNVGTFLMIYIFYLKYINLDVSKVNNKFRGFLFVVLLCFFASFIEGAMIYVHFQIIDPSYYPSKIQPVLSNMIESFPYPQEVKTSALTMVGNNIWYVLSTFIGNLFLGVLLGTPLALLVKKNNT